MRLGIQKYDAANQKVLIDAAVYVKTLMSGAVMPFTNSRAIGTTDAMKMLQEVKINNGKEVRKMKTSIALLTNLIISSTLVWGVPTAGSQEVMLRVPAETTSYCHMKFP